MNQLRGVILLLLMLAVLLSFDLFANEVIPESLPSTVTAENVYRFDQENSKFSFTKFEPTYLVYGEPLTKLQFSFKYQLFVDEEIFFGYAQLIFWDLGAASSPIVDVNYAPNLFYQWEFNRAFLKSIDISPFGHVSNGRYGADSRGYNIAYLQVNALASLFNNTLSVSARLSKLYDIEDTNSDITEFISPLELKILLTEFFPRVFDRGELYFRIFPGGSYGQYWDQGGQEIGLSFRPSGIKIIPAFFVQYYGGFAESLLFYKRQESLTRFGVIF